MPGKVKGQSHVVTAGDVSAGTILLGAGSNQSPLRGVQATVTRAGVAVAWDGAAVVADHLITIDNAGAVDWILDDVINVLTW